MKTDKKYMKSDKKYTLSYKGKSMETRHWYPLTDIECDNIRNEWNIKPAVAKVNYI